MTFCGKYFVVAAAAFVAVGSDCCYRLATRRSLLRVARNTPTCLDSLGTTIAGLGREMGDEKVLITVIKWWNRILYDSS